MDYIDKLLETEEGAKTLKSHLKSVPKYEKAKPQFQRLWQLACDAVNKHHNIKQKKLRDQKKREEYQKLVVLAKGSKPKYLFQTTKAKGKVRNAVLMLAKFYPKTFDYEHPKPLKINITEDLRRHGKMDNKVLGDTLNYYTRSAQYYYSFVTHSHRYNLSGKAVAALTEEEKTSAISMLYQTIGRLNMEQDYPDLVSQVIDKSLIETPEVVVKVDYGNHYYSENLLKEVREILLDCYGKSVCLAEHTSRTKSRFVSVVQVMRQDVVLFEAEAEGQGFKNAQHVALSRLLVTLQREIEAYPFGYERNVLDENQTK